MIDNIGRNIDSGMSGADLKGLVESLAKGNVGTAKPFNTTASQDSDKLLSDLKSYIPKFSDAIKSVENLVKSVKDFMGNKGQVKETKDDKMGFNADKMMKKLAEKGLKKGSIYTHDIYLEKMQKLMYLQMQKQTAILGNIKFDKEGEITSLEEALKEHEDAKKTPEGPDSITIKGKKRAIDELTPLELMMGRLSKFGDDIETLQQSLMGFSSNKVIFDGLIDKERDFTIDVRQIAFEIAGATKESRSLQRSFEDIGDTVAITGFDRSTTTAAYLKALKKGTKEQKVALGIVKNQLNTEKLIGVEAGTLEDTFSNMSLQMDMSNSQMGEFGRGILDVARSTGVTGENLARAIRSSERIMKNMRNFGTITAKGAANIVGALASAEKFGVGEFAEGLFDTLSQGMYGFNNANREMQSFIAQAVGGNAKLLQQMQDGTLANSKEGMTELAGGVDDMLRRFGVHSEEQFKNMSSSQKQYINTMMKSAFGVTAVEALKTSKSIKEANKPFIEQLDDIKKERDAINKITDVELRKEKELALIEKERSLQTNTSLGVLSSIQDKMKDGVSFDEAAKSLSKFDAKELKALQEKTGTKDGSDLLRKTAKELNKGLLKAKETPINIDPKEMEKALAGDKAATQSVMDQLNEGNQRLAMAQKKSADPITNLNNTLTELNDYLRGQSQGVISSILNSAFAETILWLGVFGNGLGSIASWVFQSIGNYKELDSKIEFFTKNLKLLGDTFKGLGSKTSWILKPIEFLGSALKWILKPIEFLGSALKWMLKPLQFLGGNLGWITNSFKFLAKGLGKLLLPLTILITVVEGLFQGFKSAAKAGEIFNKKQEDVTTTEKAAAGTAGFLTGLLNSITFGFFDSTLGATGTWTKGLAHFFNNMFNWIGNSFSNLFGWIGNTANSWIKEIQDIFSGGFLNIIKNIGVFILSMPLRIIKGIIQIQYAIIDWIGQMFGMVPGAIGESMYSAASAVGLGWLIDSMIGTSGGKSPPAEATPTEAVAKTQKEAVVSKTPTEAVARTQKEAVVSKTPTEVVSETAIKKEVDAIQSLTNSLYLGSELISLTLDFASSQLMDSFEYLSKSIVFGSDLILANNYKSMLGMFSPLTSLFSPTSSLIDAVAGLFSPTVAITAPNAIEDRVERDVASVESSATMAGSEELGNIASANQTQVDQMKQMIDLLTQMVDHLAPSTGGSAGGLGSENTMLNNITTSPPKYYKWSVGKHNQAAAIGITNLANIG